MNKSQTFDIYPASLLQKDAFFWGPFALIIAVSNIEQLFWEYESGTIKTKVCLSCQHVFYRHKQSIMTWSVYISHFPSSPVQWNGDFKLLKPISAISPSCYVFVMRTLAQLAGEVDIVVRQRCSFSSMCVGRWGVRAACMVGIHDAENFGKNRGNAFATSIIFCWQYPSLG